MAVLLVSLAVIAAVAIWGSVAVAGEPEFACFAGSLVGTECEVVGSPPVLDAPCPDPSAGAEGVFFNTETDDGLVVGCYEYTPANGAICSPPSVSYSSGSYCAVEVAAIGPAVLTCETAFDLVDERCIRLIPAACTSIYVEVWIDDNGDGIRQSGETTDDNATVVVYEATLEGTPGDQVTPVNENCVMSGSYLVQVVSDRVTIQNATGGSDDSDVDQTTGISDVLDVPALGSAFVQAGVFPADQPVPLVPALSTPAFTCENGINFEIAGGTAPYSVFFLVMHPPSGGLPVTDIYPHVTITESGSFTTGVPYARSYRADRVYSIEMRLEDITGRSAEATAYFMLSEDCIPGPKLLQPAGYVPVTPRRIIDSRSHPSLNTGPFSSAWGPGSTRTIDATTNESGVPDQATAVAVHITTVNANTAFSWLTAYPAGESRPNAASITYGTGDSSSAITNDLVITEIDSNGNFDIFNHDGSTDVVVDLVGYYLPDDTAALYVPIVPSRIIDSRGEPGLNTGPYNTAWTASTTRTIDATVAASVPQGVTAVVANVTTVNADAPISWLTAYPTGEDQPTTASMLFGTSPATSPITNDLVITGVDENGNFDLYNEAGTTDIVVDIVGYFTTLPDPEAAKYVSVSPSRVIDSRPQLGLNLGPYSTPWTPGLTRRIDNQVQGWVPIGATAAVVQITTVNADAAFSWLTTHPTGTVRPTAASLNFGNAEVTQPITNDVVIVKLGPNRSFDLYNHAGSTDIVIDLVGYFE